MAGQRNGGGLRQRAAAAAGKREIAPFNDAELIGKIRAMEAQFDAALPRGADAAQMVRDSMTLVRNTPKLAACDPRSVIGGLMTFAQLGLRPGVPQLQHGWLLPFAGKAQLVIGYGGLAELALRHPVVGAISARTVYANDEYDVEYGLHEQLRHRPHLGPDRGDPVAYYCVVRIRDSDPMWHFMTRADVEAHRDRFALQRDFHTGAIKGPWVDHFDEMAKKTCFRMLAKLLPKSTELGHAMQADGTVRVNVDPTATISDVVAAPLPDDAPDQGPTADPVTGEVLPDPQPADDGDYPVEDFGFPPSG